MAFGLTQLLGEVEEHPQARLSLGDVQLCCHPQTSMLRYGSCCSSNGLFQVLLGLFIQQLFFLLWFPALCQWWHLHSFIMDVNHMGAPNSSLFETSGACIRGHITTTHGRSAIFSCWLQKAQNSSRRAKKCDRK